MTETPQLTKNTPEKEQKKCATPKSASKVKKSPIKPKKSPKKVKSDPTTLQIASFFTIKKPKKPTIVKAPKPPPDHFHTDLWSSASLIPFVKSPSYEVVENWISNFSQSKPCCILFGETSSGKSRIIEQISIKHSLHIIYIDCAVIKDVKRMMLESEEATKSRSMGGSFSSDVKNAPNSMVVFEHFDSLFQAEKPVSSAVLQMLSSARVPIILTAYSNVFKCEDWLLPVFCFKLFNSEAILHDAVWVQRGWGEDKEECYNSIRKLLFMTCNDIRKTSMQMMLMNNHHGYLPRDETVYHSVPSFCSDEESLDTEKYADLMDCLCLLNVDDLLFDDYIRKDDIFFRPFGFEEKLTRERARVLHRRIPHSRTTFMPDVEILEIGTTAAQNAIEWTRSSKRVMIPDVFFNNAEIDMLSRCYLYE